MTGISSARARLYETVRTAHLERARQLEPAAIVYRTRRYDFDASAAEGLELIQASPVRAAWLLARSRVRLLEVNEPLQLSSGPGTAIVLAALGIARALGRPRTVVVAYAIENADPRAFPVGPRLRSRVRRRVELALARRVWQRLDRIVYGTPQAEAVHAATLPPHRGPLLSGRVLALPAALPEAVSAAKEEASVVFLGALVERKGFPLLAEAWPHVLGLRPDARLTILGTGALADRADELARRYPGVTFLRDPGRDAIRRTLLRSRVLVLPSQPQPGWREQVGLPLVEGLSAGCSVVTTTETGIADWLAGHGHRTLPVPTGPEALARAIADAIEEDRPAAAIVAPLPPVDGRLEADRRLFGPAAQFAPNQAAAVADPAPAGDQRSG